MRAMTTGIRRSGSGIRRIDMDDIRSTLVELLQVINTHMPDFYEYIEHRTSYDISEYLDPKVIDDEVDKAELRELANIILEELDG